MFDLMTLLFIAGVTALLYLLYKWSISPYTFFEKKGIPFKKPLPLFGNFGAMNLKMESFHDLVLNACKEFKDQPYFGMFEFRKPLLTICDPELIKQITVKDFEHFLDHRQFAVDEDAEPLFGKSLFMLSGQKWRDMRATLSPAFTGSKMRQMFELIVACAEQSTEMIVKECETTNKQSKPFVLEMKDLYSRFATDVIATAAFGIEVNSLKNRENDFFMMGKKSTSFDGFGLIIKLIFITIFPKFAKTLGVRFFGLDQLKFYKSMVMDTIRYREKNGIIRHDMINLLIEAQKGALRTNEQDGESEGFSTVLEVSNDQLKGNQKRAWDDDDLTAQCFLFFFAGFETVSTLLCFVTHELTVNPDVQKKLIEEIDTIRAELNGKPFNYDIMQKMIYLDMVISETLRKWPPAVAVDRLCVKKYEMTTANNNKTVTIDQGDGIWIPIFGIHRNPEYYPNPDKFDPERFSEENKKNIAPFTYLPFGSGPRNCIGSRFALMECKVVLFYILSKFTFEVAETTQIPLVIAKSGFNVKSEKGFNILFKPRK